MAANTAKIWSGFWPRLGAWVIDLILLAIICGTIGGLGITYTAGWGSNGRFIGLGLGILYFGLTASRIGGSASLGMRLLGLKVVHTDGRAMDLPAAFGRALFLVGPVLLNGWYFAISDITLATIAGIVAITAVFGIGLAQIYLLLFNLPTRRMVHDLLFDSIVVKAATAQVQSPPVRAHGVVATGLVLCGLALAVSGPVALRALMPRQATLSQEQKVADAVDALPGVVATTVQTNTTTWHDTSGSRTVRTLVVTARVRQWPANVNLVLAPIGAAAVKHYSFAPGERLTVRLIYGFDLGFATYTNAYNSAYSTTCTTGDEHCLP